MGMSLVDETFEVYVQMRSGGKEAKSALEALRLRIEVMEPDERNEMVRRVKTWETLHQNGVPAKSKGPPSSKDSRPPSNRPPSSIGNRPPSSTDNRSTTKQPHAQPKPIAKTAFCPRCGKPNGISEVFCAYCGNFLRVEGSAHETTKLQEPELLGRGADYFGEATTLVLIVAGTNSSYSIQPQKFKHETVIGRSEGSTMRPDIDLSTHNASEMGVSRLHVALQYNAKNNLLSVSDMKSANGTFINGQKLYPQEVRVLRDGDELRLGRLILRAYFRQGDDQ